MANLGLEILGWGGVVILIIAYALLTEGKIKAQSKIYQAVNMIGDFLKAGFKFKLLIANLHAHLDDQKSPWELLHYGDFIGSD